MIKDNKRVIVSIHTVVGLLTIVALLVSAILIICAPAILAGFITLNTSAVVVAQTMWATICLVSFLSIGKEMS